jgi:ribonuclease P protein component
VKPLSFPKSSRLISNKQFKAVMSGGVRASDGPVILYICENKNGHNRLGISIAKASGNAVVRNRLKRLNRESFRLNQHQIPSDFDYLLIISPKWSKKLDEQKRSKEALKKVTFKEVESTFLALIERAMRQRKTRS